MPLITPSVSAVNFTPSSTAFRSESVTVAGVALLDQMLQGHDAAWLAETWTRGTSAASRSTAMKRRTRGRRRAVIGARRPRMITSCCAIGPPWKVCAPTPKRPVGPPVTHCGIVQAESHHPRQTSLDQRTGCWLSAVFGRDEPGEPATTVGRGLVRNDDDQAGDSTRRSAAEPGWG